MEGYLNTQEAADALAIHRGGVLRAVARDRFTLYNRAGNVRVIGKKELKPVKIGRDWFIPVESVEAYMGNRKRGWPLGVPRGKRA